MKLSEGVKDTEDMMLWQEAYDPLTFTFLSSDDAEVLWKYAAVPVVVELGTARGGTARFLSYRAEKLYTIDLFEDNPFPLLFLLMEVLTFQDVCLSLADRANVEVIKGCTWKEAENFDKVVDFLFIDADHTYESVIKGIWLFMIMMVGVAHIGRLMIFWPEVMRFSL